MQGTRQARLERKTRETCIVVELDVDGEGQSKIKTPLGFLDHLLDVFTRFGWFNLNLTAEGEFQVDQHHLLEDCGFVLGKAFGQALRNRAGINRAGFFVLPQDESLAVVAVDLSGRPFVQYKASYRRQFCGGLDTDCLEDFFHGFARGVGGNLVVQVPRGKSDHHKTEAIFKALGRAMWMACSYNPRLAEIIPSTKGVIDYDWDN